MEQFIFIEPESEFHAKERQNASYLRKHFYIDKAVEKAVLDLTALGVYIGYLNGAALTQETLMPGYTDYKYRVQYQSYDVTDRLVPGKNVVAAVIGDGWYRGGLGAASRRNSYGTRLKFALRLTLHYQDGRIQVLDARDAVAIQDGALRQNDIKIDEVYDACKELDGWNSPDFDDSSWHAVQESVYGGMVIPHIGEPILLHEQFSAKVLHTPDGGTVLDFGQDMMGRVKFRINAPAGHKVVLFMGETLDENGKFTMANLKIKGAGNAVSDKLQRLEYHCKDGVQEYMPHFLTCGFRYVKLINWPEEVKTENFQAFAVYSDLREVGSFQCSNPLVNRFVQNVRWSQKSNFLDIPTDCPTRERTGWTADISVFAQTACYFTDTRKFLHKWFGDYILEQQPDGNLPFVVPESEGVSNTWGCMGWSNALCNVAMTMYTFYGDPAILENVYLAVKRFVDFNIGRAKRSSIKSLWIPAKDRQWIVDTGFHFGEWLEPGSNMVKDFVSAMIYPDIEVTTGWFYQTTSQLSQMAQILGYTDDWQTYSDVAERIKAAYRSCFIKNGTIRSNRQCKYVRPLAMGLVAEQERKTVARQLNQMCKDKYYCIGTGFLTTWQILQVLTDHGYADTAYRVLENTQCPGWLYTVTKGATTTWEKWDGIDSKGRPSDSLNHYAMGAAVSWLFSHCAGIRPHKPGFEEILIKPIPGGTFTNACAKYDSPVGKIISAWECSGDQFTLHIQTPEGHKVYVELPDGTCYESNGGCMDYRCCLRV